MLMICGYKTKNYIINEQLYQPTQSPRNDIYTLAL